MPRKLFCLFCWKLFKRQLICDQASSAFWDEFSFSIDIRLDDFLEFKDIIINTQICKNHSEPDNILSLCENYHQEVVELSQKRGLNPTQNET